MLMRDSPARIHRGGGGQKMGEASVYIFIKRDLKKSTTQGHYQVRVP